jgi:hypothetical protein
MSAAASREMDLRPPPAVDEPGPLGRAFPAGGRLGDVMHILILLVGAIVGVAIWYFRFRGPAAVGDVIDAAGHAKGIYKRRKFLKKVQASTLAGIDDPGLAAAVFLVSLAENGPGLSPAEEEAITVWLRDTVEYHDPAEAVIFAKWASHEVVDVNEVIRRLLPLWCDKLDQGQRGELIAGAIRVASIKGPDAAQMEAIRRLKQGLAN